MRKCGSCKKCPPHCVRSEQRAGLQRAMDLSGDAGLSDEGGCPCLPAAAGCRRDGKRDVREAPNHAVRSVLDPLVHALHDSAGATLPGGASRRLCHADQSGPGGTRVFGLHEHRRQLFLISRAISDLVGWWGKNSVASLDAPPKPDCQVGVLNGTPALHLWPRVQKKDSKRAQKGSSENVSNQIR